MIYFIIRHDIVKNSIGNLSIITYVSVDNGSIRSKTVSSFELSIFYSFVYYHHHHKPESQKTSSAVERPLPFSFVIKYIFQV